MTGNVHPLHPHRCRSVVFAKIMAARHQPPRAGGYQAPCPLLLWRLPFFGFAGCLGSG